VTRPLITGDGQIRTDDAAVRSVIAALEAEDAVREVVDALEARIAAPGTFGLLIPGRSRVNGAEVLVKVNATAHERAWLKAIGGVDPEVAPAVFADGDSFGDIQLGWAVIERLPYQPPGFAGPEWYEPIIRASLRWQLAARSVDLPPVHEIDGPWMTMWLDRAVERGDGRAVEELRQRFDGDWAWLLGLCPSAPCHGDLHFFNAGSRTPGIPAAFVLFDPMPRVAPWPFDVANCETLTNYRATSPDGSPLVARAAELRRERGLPTPDRSDVDRISALLCAWLGVMWSVHLFEFQPERRESSVRYVEDALSLG
jgi:hypothetical protein